VGATRAEPLSLYPPRDCSFPPGHGHFEAACIKHGVDLADTTRHVDIRDKRRVRAPGRAGLWSTGLRPPAYRPVTGRPRRWARGRSALGTITPLEGGTGFLRCPPSTGGLLSTMEPRPATRAVVFSGSALGRAGAVLVRLHVGVGEHPPPFAVVEHGVARTALGVVL
jgi:hypothetical protein